ncbi:retrotransposon protein, putative, ty1-copia subclass [Tanacetum coccineum]
MDGIVHTYKARLVAKGFTQHYEVDYEETFSPIADIRAIRILIAIAEFYDYEIWQMDVKTTFLNSMDILMKTSIWCNLKVLLILIIPGKYVSFKDPFMDLSKHQEARIKDLIRKSKDDTKSQIGYVFVLNRGAVDWKSSKQSTTAMSIAESEYIAASEAAMEAFWIRKFISRLGIVPTINELLNMYRDNSAAVNYANEPGVQKGARHYQRQYHYVRECIELSEIRILKVYTYNNLADPFTKALSNKKLTQHARGMGLRPASSFM